MSSDVWLEPEFWTDFGELDEVEKNELFILTNELFTISPKKGCLDPGSHVSITFTHKLVILLTVKSILLTKSCLHCIDIHTQEQASYLFY